MSYHINGDIIKLDIKVPKSRAMELLELDPGYGDNCVISSQGIELTLDEQTEGTIVPLVGDEYHFSKKTVPHVGGNKSGAEDFFTELAKRFKGNFEARFTGEDGRTWAVKIVQGVQKKVEVVIIEE